jgi:transposase
LNGKRLKRYFYNFLIPDAQSTIKLFQQIEAQNPPAGRIHIICDNARYYHAQLVKDYLEHSKIKLVFLPPYAPNLNLIERFWKFFKKTVLYGRYYETFSQFKTACDDFFTGLDQHHASLRSLLTDRFQIIGQG